MGSFARRLDSRGFAVARAAVRLQAIVARFFRHGGKHLNTLSGFAAVTFTKVTSSSNNINNLRVEVYSSRPFVTN